jgi:prepilin-type processing-associated H-X9-DG protein
LGKTWVEGWLGLPGPDCTNILHLKNSLLSPHINDPALWRCPVRRDPKVSNITMPRVRTISMNFFMGAPVQVPGATCYQQLSQILRPSPSEAIVFLDERIDTINDGTFTCQWNFDPDHPAQWRMVDKPSTHHQRGCSLTFADGHAATHTWKDSRTISAPRNSASMPGNLDLLWLDQHATWRPR